MARGRDNLAQQFEREAGCFAVAKGFWALYDP
jgi:hypothetical protein